MRVLIAGDYVPRERIADMMKVGDFSYFRQIKSLTQKSDLSIVNLEAPIVINNANPIKKHGPNLKTSYEVVDSLKYAGFDMVTLANNHIMDFGDKGLKDTLFSLQSSGILHVGVGNNLKDANSIKFFEQAGERVAIINCCEHEFSIATEDSPGANPLNLVSQFYSIQEARNNADYVIVIVHGGHEHWQLPSPRMVETYRFFIDTGADAVINHHQHCFSGYEVYKNKPIFYGLGNLCFEYSSKNNQPWNFGYLVSFDFSKKGIEHQIHPYEQCSESPIIHLLPNNAFDERLKIINDIVADNNLLKKETDKYYNSAIKAIKNSFEPFTGRIIGKLRSLNLMPPMISERKRLIIENLINCESHRDKVNHWLSNSK